MRVVLLLGLLTMSPGAWPAAPTAAAAAFGGKYISEESASVSLTLIEADDGGVTGTLAESGQSLPMTGRRQGPGLAGNVGAAGSTLPFKARFEGQRLLLDIGLAGEAQQIAFAKAGAGAGDSRVTATAPAGQRRVIINNTMLTDAALKQVEQTYRIRIPDAEYWYDRVLGAWGAKGGPTMGFIVPGLDLGGPLRPDASGQGATNIFVNGRELHPYDMIALQRITGPILPGRYFITATGAAGMEGGSAQWNLAAMAAQAGGGGSSSWQSRLTGASGISGDGVSAVFLPNGGIVSSGTN